MYKYFFIMSIFSLVSFAWETKEEFDKDFKTSVKQFLAARDQSHIFFGNISEFITTHNNFLKEYHKFCTYDPIDPNRPWFGVMKEIKSFSELKMDEFDSFFCVGPKKSLANLPTHTYIIDEDIKTAIENWATSIEYKTYIDTAPGEHGALWVFDPIALKKLLDEHSSLLKENNVSSEPLTFIKEIDKQDEKGQSPFDLKSGNILMFQLIARAFGREITLEEISKLKK